jgi:nucleotide-binding universal stress UspA family protein
VFTTIVVPIDLDSERDVARRFAAALARRAGAGLELVSVASPLLDHERDEQVLAQLGAALAVPHVTGRVLESNDVAAVLLEEAGDSGLLCMETHAHGSITTLFVGSVTSEILRQASHPVLLVGPHTKPEPAIELLEMCIDAEDAANSLTPVVGEWARALRVPVRVLRVMDPDQPFDDTEDDVREQLHAIVERLQAEYGVSGEYVILHGAEVPTLIGDDAERHGASVVAVSVRRRSLLRRAVLGSVAMALAHGTTASVLAVPCCPVHA